VGCVRSKAQENDLADNKSINKALSRRGKRSGGGEGRGGVGGGEGVGLEKVIEQHSYNASTCCSAKGDDDRASDESRSSNAQLSCERRRQR
jgi:hypothetical protein